MNHINSTPVCDPNAVTLPATLAAREEYIQEYLRSHGQEHVLNFWDELNQDEQTRLAQQIASIDLEKIEGLFSHYGEPASIPADPSLFEEPQGVSLEDGSPTIDREEAIQCGTNALHNGHVGVVIVAGGQGSRLGFEHPKGMFPIGPVSEATLFEILFSKILAVGEKYGRSIPVFLMTSPATHAETVEFLAANDRFGIDESDLTVFCQGTMPAVDIETGKLLMANKNSLFQSPDGHGGMLSALENAGAFSKMKDRGVRHLFYMQIDNPLVDVAAPEAIGYHVLSQSQATTMVIRKNDPVEKVGNVAVLNGETQIIEYSDLPDSVANLKNDDGSLLLWAGNVAVHIWDVDFLNATASSADGLPFHYALKKVPFVDQSGKSHSPGEPNGIKFERFIFDLLPMATKSIVVEVDRASYFAPLKNPSSAPADNAETVGQQMLKLHHRWIENASGSIADGVKVEIHPCYAVSSEDVAGKLTPGTEFSNNTVLKD